MNKTIWLGLCNVMLLANLTAGPLDTPSAPRRTEDELIIRLGSSDPKKVTEALDQLVNRYPNSTNAIPAIRSLLTNKPVQKKAAYALGEYHAELDLDEVKVILGFLRSYDVDEVMDTLKVLRALKEPEAINQKIVADILPLLQDPETHVVRDACRTLAVLGNKDIIPAIQPLLKNSRSDIRTDAQDAIAKLNAKS